MEQYREFITALSGIIGSRSSAEAQRRYADSVNGLTLAASPEVLKEVDRFADETSYRNAARSQASHDEILSALLNAMRIDIGPGGRSGKLYADYRMMDVPPEPRAADS